MKKTILSCLLFTVLLSSCGNDAAKTPADKKDAASFTSEETEKSGSYTVDGQVFKGRITLQNMAKDQYSVICQQDEPSSMLQIIFTNEKEARANSSLTPGESFYSMEPGEVHVSLSGDKEFTTKDKSPGSITVANNTVTLKDVQLINSDKVTKTVSASLSF